MNRMTRWMIVLGCAALPVSVMAAEPAKSQPATPAVASAQIPAAPAPAADEKVVFTFPDEAKMKEFEELWRERQVAAVRMTVLQSYWNEEQAAITKLNEALSKDYKVDVTKAYSLDPKRRVLIEHDELPTPPGAADTAPPVALP